MSEIQGKRNWLQTNSLYATLIVLLACTVSFAQPATQPNSTNRTSAEQAEINLLRRTIERQQKDLDLVKTENAALVEQVRSLGLVPATSSTTQPAINDGVVRRVVYLRVSSGANVCDQIVASIADLAPTQYFNVLLPTRAETYLFQPQLVPATDFHKQKVREYLSPNTYFAGDWLAGIAAAAKWKPDVIWIVGELRVQDEEQSIAELKKHLAGSTTKVNTSTAFSPSAGEERHHLLWRIAAETGGQCLDKEGRAILEPALPVKPAPRPPPPAPRSILPTR